MAGAADALGLPPGHARKLGNGRDARRRQLRDRDAAPMPVNADGEIITRTPAKFRVLSRALRVIAPDC